MKKIMISALLFLSASAVVASPVTTLQGFLNKINTMQADFKQKVLDENNKILNTYTGKMQFKKPNLFYWQVEAPDASLLVTNGVKLWNYEPSLEQVTVQRYSADKDITPLSFVLSGDKIDSNFTVEQKQNNCFKLTPKIDNPNFANVSVCFKSDYISSLQIYDNLGQTSIFEFYKVQNNGYIALENFVFKPPAGVDVIGE